MEMPDKENFIEVLTFIQNLCEEPKDCECNSCCLAGEFKMCSLCTPPEYWDIDDIVKSIYGG